MSAEWVERLQLCLKYYDGADLMTILSIFAFELQAFKQNQSLLINNLSFVLTVSDRNGLILGKKQLRCLKNVDKSSKCSQTTPAQHELFTSSKSRKPCENGPVSHSTLMSESPDKGKH